MFTIYFSHRLWGLCFTFWQPYASYIVIFSEIIEVRGEKGMFNPLNSRPMLPPCDSKTAGVDTKVQIPVLLSCSKPGIRPVFRLLSAYNCRRPIQGGPKNWHNVLYALTLPNINRFSKFFHFQNQEKIYNNTITRDCTTPQLCRYTTLCPTKAPRRGALPSRPRPAF